MISISTGGIKALQGKLSRLADQLSGEVISIRTSRKYGHPVSETIKGRVEAGLTANGKTLPVSVTHSRSGAVNRFKVELLTKRADAPEGEQQDFSQFSYQFKRTKQFIGQGIEEWLIDYKDKSDDEKKLIAAGKTEELTNHMVALLVNDMEHWIGGDTEGREPEGLLWYLKEHYPTQLDMMVNGKQLPDLVASGLTPEQEKELFDKAIESAKAGSVTDMTGATSLAVNEIVKENLQ
jgi:hypothetical protein